MLSLADLIVPATKTEIYDNALQIAESLGLPTTAWQAGDPTRSLYYLEAETLASVEELVTGFISSGFIGLASGIWLQICAEQMFGVPISEATPATGSVTLTNDGGGFFTIDAGDLTFRNSVTNETYHNTSGGTLASWPGYGDKPTLSVDVEADNPSTVGNAAAGEIDTLVTTLLDVSCTNPSALVGLDASSEATIRKLCSAKLDALCDKGPSGVYDWVVMNQELTGPTGINRTRTFADSDSGEVDVYVASGSGAASSADVVAAQTAVDQWAEPLCIRATVRSATPYPVSVTATVYVYQSVGKTNEQLEDDIQTALENMFLSREIGGDVVTSGVDGKLYRSLITSTILGTSGKIFRVELTNPSSDVSLTNTQVAALSSLTLTIVQVRDP